MYNIFFNTGFVLISQNELLRIRNLAKWGSCARISIDDTFYVIGLNIFPFIARSIFSVKFVLCCKSEFSCILGPS